MDSVIDSETIIVVAYWIATATLILTVSLLAVILVMRVVLIRRKELRRRTMATWRPLMMESLHEIPEHLPPLARRDLPVFLELWNKLHETLRGEAGERLNQLARQVGASTHILRMLTRPGFRERLAGVASAGHLRDRAAWDRVRRLIDQDNPVLSLAAARALVQIDAAAAVPLLLPLISTRRDWPSARLAAILREAGAEHVAGPLIQAALEAPADAAPQLIRYMQLADTPATNEAVAQILHTTSDERVISSCLQVLTDPRHLDLVRTHVGSASWYVRVQAANAIGRLGVRGDERRLIELLGDREWWVRYRAAQALATLPFLRLADLQRLQVEQSDNFARDMLTQVIAEKRLGSTGTV